RRRHPRRTRPFRGGAADPRGPPAAGAAGFPARRPHVSVLLPRFRAQGGRGPGTHQPAGRPRLIPPSAAAARTRRIFVVTPPGLEQVTAAEIAALSLSAEPEAGGLALDGSDRELYTLNLHLRTASRVLVRVAE